MVETAAHLADHVILRLPVRQWVLSVPKRLRLSPGARSGGSKRRAALFAAAAAMPLNLLRRLACAETSLS